MSEWQFTWHNMDDGAAIRAGVWAGPQLWRGTCVLVTGRGEFLEKFAETAADFAQRGWRLVGWDWRGQGLSARPLPDRHKGHIGDFTRFLDDMDRLLPTLLGDRSGPVIGFGHSMGGHILLRYAAERPNPFAALVLCAPMLDLAAGLELSSWLGKAGVAMGLAESYVPGQGGYRPSGFMGNPLTSDPNRFQVHPDAVAANPTLALGGVTFGWLDAACRSIHGLMTPESLARVTIPVLLLSAGADRVVRPAGHDRAAQMLPHAVLRRYDQAKHELMMEQDSIRHQIWQDIDQFLQEIPSRG